LRPQLLEGLAGFHLSRFRAITAARSPAPLVQVQHAGQVARVPAVRQPVLQRLAPARQVAHPLQEQVALGRVGRQARQLAVCAIRPPFCFNQDSLKSNQLIER